ncbi:Helicase conserved C-terminal domain-containing protein [Gracilibacillus orientalis]|uniref:Helicase conserved C-terminal domain-containing protein n=1 Tax=Gracilibacillus orientalis TaxID=334253 RepID=A0A1I4K4R5_9BACI|nr:DEAD/DEAH box helicase [Gracilibacillus orientalis]SFL73587.1 Helicase conserved C-terminal domain-containing protein [Gracilibacillus orientalis]
MLRPGLYEKIVNKELKEALSMLEDDQYDISKENLDAEEASKKLASYITDVTRRALTMLREKTQKDKSLLYQIKVCNKIIRYLSKTLDEETLASLQIQEEGEVLTSLYERFNTANSLHPTDEPIRPLTSLSETSLFTGSKSEPNMVNELKKEIVSSDKIQMLVSFIKWSGLRIIFDELKQFTDRGGELHIISTSYMGATDYKAINELSKLHNTTIKLSYNVKVTRLHAKAYIFKRDTNFSTAYIGSSNLSNPALTSGLEWNLKITEKESFDVMKKVDATFDSYWNDEEFILFDPNKQEDHEVLKESLQPYRAEESHFATFDIRPFPYQQEVLDKLQAEREVHHHHKNLIVAATGVGKTVISAFDYKRFLEKNGRPARLLFVAHRKEILKQALETFRHILKDFNFGELLFGGVRPQSIDHLFITIDSLNSKELFEHTSSDFYDYIVVDEFHHAAAASYQKLLDYYSTKVLLGLTATPERMDGKSVINYFDGRIAAEIRLMEAIDRKLLSPFQYFGVTDTVDLSKVKFTRKGYDLKELENVYTHNTKRVQQIIHSVNKYVTDIDTVKGLGFCVSVEHAKYMAKQFNDHGIPSLALDGNTHHEIRDNAKNLLEKGDITFIFVVDLYNEGVDIPQVNTILFLRPTESLTVFLQQLGRGLRLHDDKECLTVLDFIGQAHKEYKFEDKFRALIGRSRHAIKHYVENGFSTLPRGSFIQLEKQAKDYVLRNIKTIKNSKQKILMKLENFTHHTSQKLTLVNFLEFYQLTAYDFYGRSGDRSFYRLLVEAGLYDDFHYDREKDITKRLPYLLHINSEHLLSFYLRYLEGGEVRNQEEQFMLNMLYYTIYRKSPEKLEVASIAEGLHEVLRSSEMKKEIQAIFKYNYRHLELVEKSHDLPFTTPLRVHSSYSTDQVLAALGYYNEQWRPEFREGAIHLKDKKADVFFITLNKSDKDFSPSTMYDDYAMNEWLFHWQSQSRTSVTSETAKRYIHHRERNHQILLFVREYRQENGYAAPFTFLGTAEYVRHSGSKPVSFVWKLHEKMPAKLIVQANKHIL